MRLFSALLIACLLGQAPAISGVSNPVPTLFEPGVISGPANDGAPTFSPDGKTLFFERTNNRWSWLLTSQLRAGHWSEPKLASFSGPSSDQQPAYSPDGRFLVYVSSRAVPTRASHLYRVDKTALGWSTPQPLPDTVNISDGVFKPSIAANGDIYFMSGGGAGPPQRNWRLYRCASINGVYQKAEPLSFSDGTSSDVDPAIAPNQSFIIFSSQGRKPMDDGHEHLFVAFRDGNGWGSVQPMRYEGDDWGADDGEANISPNGKTLYFTSGRSLPASHSRTLPEMREAYSRMKVWDNSNSNVWTLPLTRYLRHG